MNRTIWTLLLAGALCAGALCGCSAREGEPAADTPSLSEEAAPVREEPAPSEPEDRPRPVRSGEAQLAPLQLPEPFGMHAGDRRYFLADGEDYLVVMYRAEKSGAYGELADEELGDVTVYEAYVFAPDSGGNPVLAETLVKLVFGSEEQAAQYVRGTGRTDLYAVEEAVYAAPAYGEATGADKAEILAATWGLVVEEYGGIAYLSIPDGYEELLVRD